MRHVLARFTAIALLAVAAYASSARNGSGAESGSSHDASSAGPDDGSEGDAPIPAGVYALDASAAVNNNQIIGVQVSYDANGQLAPVAARRRPLVVR